MLPEGSDLLRRHSIEIVEGLELLGTGCLQAHCIRKFKLLEIISPTATLLLSRPFFCEYSQIFLQVFWYPPSIL